MLLRTLLVLGFLLSCGPGLSAQVETLPVNHPVYPFLKRMEIRGLLQEYSSALLPIARNDAGRFLDSLDRRRSGLSPSERGWLDDFLAEFRFDRTGIRSEGERYLVSTADSSLGLFVNGLLDLDLRRRGGDELRGAHAEFVQAGLRLRGTWDGSLGFFGQATNAQYWGSTDLLASDPAIAQSYALRTADSRNFDFSEGGVRFQSGGLSVELARGRLLWGNGEERMVLSDNAPVPDYLRAEFRYKALRYTFVHGWILGSRSSLFVSDPADSSFAFIEPVRADKYVVAHRVALHFPGIVEVGFQEMYIYSNRSVDLAYLNPLVLLESVQRARGERDNGLWAFDATSKAFDGVQFYGTLLLDDIHIPGIFSDSWYDKRAIQLGGRWANPLGIENVLLKLEYTRVEPWTFGHDRSRDNAYASDGLLLGSRIGPNADAWQIRLEAIPLRNLFISAGVFYSRKGENVVDPSGRILRNVGADIRFPHRLTDPEIAQFLDGVLTTSRRFDCAATLEVANQCWLDARVLASDDAVTLFGRFRIEL